MKPYGREKKIRFSSKRDCHPKKGYVNWWEKMCDVVSRTTMKLKWKKQIQNDIKQD